MIENPTPTAFRALSAEYGPDITLTHGHLRALWHLSTTDDQRHHLEALAIDALAEIGDIVRQGIYRDRQGH